MTIPVAGIHTAIDGEGEHLAGLLTFASHPAALRLLHAAQPASQTPTGRPTGELSGDGKSDSGATARTGHQGHPAA
jgi:hypothetical protein